MLVSVFRPQAKRLKTVYVRGPTGRKDTSISVNFLVRFFK